MKSQYLKYSLILFLSALPLSAAMRNVTDDSISDESKAAINKNFKNLAGVLSNKEDYRNAGYKVGTFTSSGSTGNQSVTGVGFKPRLVMLFLILADSSFVQFGIGAMDSNGSQFGGGGMSFGADSGGVGFVSNKCVSIANEAGTINYRASYVSMDSDGFTINWDAVAARLFGYIAFQ